MIATFFAYGKQTGKVIGFAETAPTNDYIAEDKVVFGSHSLAGFVGKDGIGFWQNDEGIEVDPDYEYTYDLDTNELTKGEVRDEIA